MWSSFHCLQFLFNFLKYSFLLFYLKIFLLYIFLATFSYQTPILSFYVAMTSWLFSFLLLHTSFQIFSQISLCFLNFLLLSKCLLLLYIPFRYFGFLLNVVYILLFKIQKGYLGSPELSSFVLSKNMENGTE